MDSDARTKPQPDRLTALIGGMAAHPAVPVLASLTAAVGLAWSLLATFALRAAETRPPGSALPGDGLLGSLSPGPLPAFVEQLLALCLTPVRPDGSGLLQFGVIAAMWFLMAIAMMLPSAAPMLKTYCEIAETAAAKGERVVHVSILLAGYLVVWLAASFGFAAVDLALLSGGSMGGAAAPPVAAAMLAFAGLYQLSPLKEACLKKCRMPFPVLFARWSARPLAIFRLGVDEGLWCLGCCWALMLVMFAVGVTNLLWMMLLAVFAIVEKHVRGPWVARGAGAILLVWSGALLLTSS